jgi:DNA-binding HxlR family transcriptional regulator
MDTKVDLTCSDTGIPSIYCPLTQVINVISSKWAFPVIYQLLIADGPIRFGILKKAIGIITQRELTRTLRHFEEFGLLTRTIYAEVPPRVEYRLTPLGESLREPILSLGQWAKEHANEFNILEKQVGND